VNESSSKDTSPEPVDRTEHFVSLLGHGELQIHAHILTLVSHWTDADEILQRTKIILWRKFDQWNPEQDFTLWACGIARFEVKNFLRTKAHDRLYFDDALFESLGSTLASVAAERAESGDQFDALQKCLQALRPQDRQIIDGCYGDDSRSAKDFAERSGRPVNTIYKALIRIRRTLFECIQRRLAAEERS
jgi:RNA polymerase sigma-70 factor (ECF subfamily)